MLFGIMPYLMEMHFRAEKEKLQAQIADRDRRIKQLEKIVAHDVKEIKSYRARLAALGEPVERTDYLSWQATMSDRIPRDGDQL
jgi:uncharacterized coiled-coil protein SlyX